MASTSQLPTSITTQEAAQGSWKRIVVFSAFLLLSLVLYVWLSLVAPQLDQPIGPFMLVWGGCFLVYLVACLWLIRTRPLTGRWYWGELGLIFLGAIIFRVMLIHLPLGLSRDAWRYLWDGRMIVHGYSPYQYAPENPVLLPLRNSVYKETPYFQFTTKYPPGAELFYVLGYLLTPTKLIGMKSLFVLCDLVTCVALVLLLQARGRDPRHALFYAWSPLPIVEFAVQSHIDALTITCTVLAILFAVSSWRYARVLTGICIGLATLTKLYPIILLLLVLRRRDWSLLIACVVTVVLGYLPFFALSHGNILDASPLSAITGQSDAHPGVVQRVLVALLTSFHLNGSLIHDVVLVAEVLIVGGTLLFIVVQRLRGRLAVEMGMLLLTWVILVVYAHVFPWYATALLPWVALCVAPVWSERGVSSRGLGVMLIWYFTFTCILSYLPVKQYATDTNWFRYYAVTFGVVLVGLIAAALLHWWRTVQTRTSSV